MRKIPEGRLITQACSDLKADDYTAIDLYDEVAAYFSPEKETLLEVTEGSEILQPITSTGINASQKLQSGLYSNSMAMGKGDLEDASEELMKLPMVSEWYAKLSNITHHHIAQSKFPQKFFEWLGDYVPFGAGVMYLQFNPTSQRHEFKVYPVGKTHWLFDSEENLSEVYREYVYSADQCVQKFGYDKSPAVVRKAWDTEDKKTKFDFIHCMKLNRDYSPESTHFSKMKYASIHVHDQTGKICKKSGSKHMRYIIERFYEKHGERNGRSPAMQCLPVIRTLMKTISDYIDGTELAVGPPMWLSDRDAVESAVLEAFGVNYADLSKGDPWMYKIDANALKLSAEFITWLKEEINQLFFVDLFAMLEQVKSGAKTAYEVQQLVAERTQAIAPIANSLSNFFRRVYFLTAQDLIDSNQIPPAPADLSGSEMQATYTSRLDVRLNEIENVSMMEAIEQAVGLVAAVNESPETRAVVKTLPALIAIFKSHNVDPESIRNLDDAETELENILKAAEDAKQAEMVAQGMKPVDTMAAPEDGSIAGNMIEDSAGGMVGL